MSDCAHYQELISRLIDREITPEEGEELAAHARECEECRAVYAAFSYLSDMLGGELVEPPEELSENIMAEIRRSELWKKNRKPRQLRRYFAVAACAVLVVGVGALTLPRLLRSSSASKAAAPQAVYSAAASEEAAAPAVPAAGAAADSAKTESSAANEAAYDMAPPISVSGDFAAPASETTKSEQEMISEAIARSEEPESVAEIVDVTGQGRGKAIAALLTGTQGALPTDRPADRSFLLRFDVDGISTQVHISVYGERVFFQSLSGEESDPVLADCKWSELYAKIYY